MYAWVKRGFLPRPKSAVNGDASVRFSRSFLTLCQIILQRCERLVQLSYKEKNKNKRTEKMLQKAQIYVQKCLETGPLIFSMW